jgi:hypothetical protein
MSIVLGLRSEASFLDIKDVSRTRPDDARHHLLSALVNIPLDEKHIQLIQLGAAFRRSLQAERKKQPWRLQTIISACKKGQIGKASLEARFFQHGGVRAVTALAATGADKKTILKQLEGLGEKEFEWLLKVVDGFEWHKDLDEMAVTVDKRRPALTAKKTALVRPRPPRPQWSGKQKANADERTNHKTSQPFSGGAGWPGPNAAERSDIAAQNQVPSSDKCLSPPGISEVAQETSAEGYLSGAETIDGSIYFLGMCSPVCGNQKADRWETTIELTWTIFRTRHVLSRTMQLIRTDSTFGEDGD